MNFLKFLFLLVSLQLCGQSGFEIEGNKKAVIPFQLINNLIFIPIEVNGVELTFLLDTGVAETLVFSLDDREVNFNNIEKVTFSGLGESTELEGLKAEGNELSVQNMLDENNTLYIILNAEINFSSHVGIPVHGIIGYHFFKNHQVEINYISKKITAFPKDKSPSKLKRYASFPITLELKKPYLYADIEMVNERKKSKMLVDLGNSDPVWLFPKLIEGFNYNRPNIDDYLGKGFNGDIFGKRSRIHGLYLGEFTFDKPVAAMPDEASIQHLKLVPDRKGSIGSGILRRFNVVFDYPNNQILLKKNRNFSDPFLFNKSGLDIKHDGQQWENSIVEIRTTRRDAGDSSSLVFDANENFRYSFVLKPLFSVAGCRKEAPCYSAGIRKGDKIISVNGKKAGDLSLEKIYNMLKADEGSFVNMLIERNGVEQKVKFELKDPIPYQ